MTEPAQPAQPAEQPTGPSVGSRGPTPDEHAQPVRGSETVQSEEPVQSEQPVRSAEPVRAPKLVGTEAPVGAPKPVRSEEAVGTDEPVGTDEAGRGSGRRPAVLVAVVAILVWCADQGTKYLAVHNLVRGERHDLIGWAFGLRLTSNPGAAFSMATGSTWIFTIIATVVAVVIIRMASRLGSYGWGLALGLLLGGAVGNLTDRLFREPGFARGHVIDFLEFPHWPIFNVADCCVVTAACLIALFSFIGLGMDGKRITDGPAADDHA